jgi:hypothetical protein
MEKVANPKKIECLKNIQHAIHTSNHHLTAMIYESAQHTNDLDSLNIPTPANAHGPSTDFAYEEMHIEQHSEGVPILTTRPNSEHCALAISELEMHSDTVINSELAENIDISPPAHTDLDLHNNSSYLNLESEGCSDMAEEIDIPPPAHTNLGLLNTSSALNHECEGCSDMAEDIDIQPPADTNLGPLNNSSDLHLECEGFSSTGGSPICMGSVSH